MTKKRKKTKKQKIVYLKQNVTRTSNELKRDINDLEVEKRKVNTKVQQIAAKKKGIGKAWTKFRGAVVKGRLNKQINERRKALVRPIQAANIKQEIQIERDRAELAKLRQQRVDAISFESLGGRGKTKSVRLEDL